MFTKLLLVYLFLTNNIPTPQASTAVEENSEVQEAITSIIFLKGHLASIEAKWNTLITHYEENIISIAMDPAQEIRTLSEIEGISQYLDSHLYNYPKAAAKLSPYQHHLKEGSEIRKKRIKKLNNTALTQRHDRTK